MEKTGGTSASLIGFLFGWVLVVMAFFGDHRDSWGTFPTTWSLRSTPYGLLAVFCVHAAFGSAALFYIVNVVVLGKLESRRSGPDPTDQGSRPPDGGHNV